MLEELHRRVDRSLLPGVKADLRMLLLYASPPPPPRLHEIATALAVAIVLFVRTGRLLSFAPSAAYLAYLVLDWRRLPQSRLAKWVRNASPVVFLLADRARPPARAGRSRESRRARPWSPSSPARCSRTSTSAGRGR